MYKRLVSLVINVNRITPIHSTNSNETQSVVRPTKTKKNRRNKYRQCRCLTTDKRPEQIISDLKNKIHISDI